MEFSPQESKDGQYDVFYTEDGQRLIVIEGLDQNDRVEHYPMQQFMMEHLDSAVVFYWLLLLAVTVYLVGMYVIIPLKERHRSSA